MSEPCSGFPAFCISISSSRQSSTKFTFVVESLQVPFVRHRIFSSSSLITELSGVGGATEISGVLNGSYFTRFATGLAHTPTKMWGKRFG